MRVGVSQPVRPRVSQVTRGALAALLAAVLFGSVYPVTSVAVESFSPFGLATLSAIVALPALWLPAAFHLRSDAATSLVPSAAVLGRMAVLGLLSAAFIVLVNAAVDLSGYAETGFVASLYAVAGSALAVPILGERLSRRTVVALCLAVAGTVGLLGDGVGGVDAVGIGLAALAALSFGLYMVLARKWLTPHRMSPIIVNAVGMLLRAVILGALVLATPIDLGAPEPTAEAIAGVVWVALAANVSATLLVLYSVRRVRVAVSASMLVAVPLSSVLIGRVLVGHALEPRQWIGAALILLGIGAVGFAPRSPTQDPSGMPD